MTHLITAELHQEMLEHRQIDTKLRGVRCIRNKSQTTAKKSQNTKSVSNVK